MHFKWTMQMEVDLICNEALQTIAYLPRKMQAACDGSIAPCAHWQPTRLLSFAFRANVQHH